MYPRVSAPVIATLALWNSALVSYAHRSDEFFLICRDGGWGPDGHEKFEAFASQ
jgi:hypothetical protein